MERPNCFCLWVCDGFVRHLGVGGGWSGYRNFCVASEPCTIVGDEDCSSRGYRTGGFKEIDTGEASRFTLRLTD
ncbi:DUF1036 domain-containing protein [Synechococcus sp. RSCCF101]|uniref:DUF1036 domain-containing protein n=1 Tax=Synechococcus sp. RSCCF101 TaxID=2511069 RepID=UPI0012490AEB|nr:DUF1036 domain-containing protein [Synechococcus sp. RSCCF101]QEY32828.1 DUF1036 domain-containing protein [Synechococcus sp. RSCCF101]